MRPAGEREARQLEPAQADLKAIEQNFLVARQAQPGAQEHGRPPCHQGAKRHEQQGERQQRGEQRAPQARRSVVGGHGPVRQGHYDNMLIDNLTIETK